MPVEAAPLFRPEIVRPHASAFAPSTHAVEGRDRLLAWARLFDSSAGMARKETELLPDLLTDVFQRILGYRGPAEVDGGRYTFSREKLVEVDGKYADAVLGAFSHDTETFIVALEGKGPKDPLDRPFGGRRMSAVDQGYRYAINLPCDWILITNLREIRLYHKGSTQRLYERFILRDVASDDYQFRRFAFLLGADRVVPREGRSHLYDLLGDSERAGERLTQEFYRTYAAIRHDLLNALLDENASESPADVLAAAQLLLDRTLFVAFAEDRSLLPADTLAKAYQHRDPYNPRPIWDNFRGLFRAIDRGSGSLRIPQYNGGLFADHVLLDRELVVSDVACQRLKRLGDYNYGSSTNGEDEEHLVDVEILGHIFEQSIEDLEAIRAEIQGGARATRATSRRKREGAFYTPTYVTRYIVSRTLGPVLSERFERLRAEHKSNATGTAVTVLNDPAVYDLEALNNPQRDALIRFWEAWIEELKTVRVLDPACGSGAFLIEVFDELHVQYQQAVDRLPELRRGGFTGSLFDPDRTILENNIYGVDLNEEAIEIARLSIWIKTAQRGKVLTDLDHNIRIGNSIVTDPELDPRAFDWWAAFPEVDAQGGFDVVVGNPPYVRGEMLADIKPYLQKHYESYHGAADLYVYFYELGVCLLRPGGRLSYVVTNKWLRAGYAEPLRAFFSARAWVEEIVDLGHAREIFPDADVFPSILRVRRPTGTKGPKALTACVIPRDELDVSDLPSQVNRRGFEVPRSKLSGSPWSLEPPALMNLLEKIKRTGMPLPEFLGVRPYRGLMTGYNKAFTITASERAAIVGTDPDCVDLIHPYVRGQDIKRWRPEWADIWMIVMRSSSDFPWPWAGQADEVLAERVFASTYPSLHEHFKQYEASLRARKDQGRFWWELRACDYYDVFHRPRLLHTDITWRAEFCHVDGPMYGVNTSYMWPTKDLYTLAVLNSPLMWSYMWRHAQHGKDEALRLFSSFTETVPIAEPQPELRGAVESRVKELLAITRGERKTLKDLHDWLRIEFGVTKLGQKLAEPHKIDSDTFIAEVRGRRDGKPSVSSVDLHRLREEFAQVVAVLRADVRQALRLETEVSDLVNAAYGLAPEEVDLLWRTAPPRMPKLEPWSEAIHADVQD